MKRVLSLLVALSMVIAVIPNVYAAKDTVDIEELTGILVVLDDISQIDVALEEGAYLQKYKWTPEVNGVLSFDMTVTTQDVTVNYTVTQGDDTVTAVDGAAMLSVVAGTEVLIQVSKVEAAAAEATLTSRMIVENNTADEPTLVEFTWNQDYTEATATVTAQPGITYFGQYRIGGMALSINGADPIILEDKGMMYPSTFQIVNDGEVAAEYTLTLTYPAGSRMNPEVLDELSYYWGELSLEEGNSQGYFYSYTAPADGSVVLYFNSVTEGVTADILVNNVNTYAQKSLLADGVDNYGLELTVEVAEGDELMIQMVVVPENWEYPAADISWFGNFTYPVGSEQNPMQPDWQWNEEETEATVTVNVPAGETIYVAGNGGMLLSINDGEPTLMQSDGFGPFAPPVLIELTNNGEAAADYVLKISHPVGAMMNPDEMVIGENTAEIGAGSDGYFYTWTATANGELTITMPGGNWSYVLNNLTTGVYGYTQYSDSDPVENPAVIKVNAGDEIRLIVNTYDPEIFWSTPAGNITFTASFEEIAYITGDLDNDGELTDWDGVLLARYLAGWNVEVEDIEALDIDADGEITDWDGVLLDRYLAGWNVTIG